LTTSVQARLDSIADIGEDIEQCEHWFPQGRRTA
jgi:hypothetical protein